MAWHATDDNLKGRTMLEGGLFEPVAVAVGLFVATNIDDVFVLLGFFSDPMYSARQVVVGQCIGIATLFAISAVASMIALLFSPPYIGLLGLVPIALGLKTLWERRPPGAADVDGPEDHAKAETGHGNIVAVAAVTIANGADNISIYTPLFATRSSGTIAVIGAVFALMTLVWLGAAHWLTNHRTLGIPIRRYGHRAVPFVLIGLGVLILSDAGTLTLVRV